MTYESQYAIGDEVKYKRYDEGEMLYGTISAIRFTKMKVFYDILDSYSGRVCTNTQSDFVTNAD